MKALSIRQPWAWAIFKAGKAVENRSWLTHWRGRLVIHAGLAKGLGAHAIVADLGGVEIPSALDYGAYIGTVRLVDCVNRVDAACPDSAWAFGPMCWLLAEPVLFDKPIPARGRQGLFTPDPEDLLQIQAAASWAAFGLGEPGWADLPEVVR